MKRRAVALILCVFVFMSCSFFGPDEKGLIEAAKEHYRYTDTEYKFNGTITSVPKNDSENILYSHIGWIEVTYIRTGISWRSQFGYNKNYHKWGPTSKQLQEDIRMYDDVIKQLKKFKS